MAATLDPRMVWETANAAIGALVCGVPQSALLGLERIRKAAEDAGGRPGRNPGYPNVSQAPARDVGRQPPPYRPGCGKQTGTKACGINGYTCGCAMWGAT